MGFTSAWAISGHPDSFIAELSPRLLPAMEADRHRPGAQDGWRRWQRAPLPDCATWYAPPGTPAAIAAVHAAVDSFLELTAPGQHVDAVCDGTADPLFYVVDDVWAGQAQEDVFLSVHSKEYPVASFLHAVGPARAALLSGWCGNFLLTSAQVRQHLGAVERALSFGPAERAAADAQDWLSYTPGEERVLDGPLRMWRYAAGNGLGLCGLAVHLY
ncbi:hypothetical protein [Streptomyces sp. XY533]|uniref:hypothetical protein n=1 Tax=Streptomyces sp. XY533 TaxID=1519481 RepID=UPI0006AD8EAF|nr:hypothetical protein [Streptomyces sp. XY533]KOU90228.1 hypothetical protein ADK92_36185 [Streptomyces sp. XY533]